MSTIALNKTGCKSMTASERKISLAERFRNYIMENSTIIISGLAMMNGGRDIYATSEMLRRQSGAAEWKK